MNANELLAIKADLSARLAVVEKEKLQLVKKLKAVDILLEDSNLDFQVKPEPGSQNIAKTLSKKQHSKASHTVRFSPRSSLIDAVKEMALKQLGAFDSLEIIKALQVEYPEFEVNDTKHISSPLSDLVKKGVLIIERARIGAKPNIYKVAASKHSTNQ